MSNYSDLIKQFDTVGFMGKGDFVWWYGVVEDRKDPLFIGRVKVRCIGWHTDDKTPEGIPTEDLPWAEVVQPIHSAAMSGIGTSPTGPLPGTHVFGFFRDGHDAQEPVVLGTVGGIPERMANRTVGFFDPRDAREREVEPYPPLFIDRTKTGQPGVIVEHQKVFSNDNTEEYSYIFNGENSLTKSESVLKYKKDLEADKAIAKVTDKDGAVQASFISNSSHPDENRMRFTPEGTLIFSLPTTNILAGNKIKFEGDDTTPNMYNELMLRTHRINAGLEEYRENLHTKIKTSNDKVFQSQPKATRDPVYPYNHLTYTESGHLFELDDTPTKERVRIMHRSTSYIEFLNSGERVDSTVGSRYDMVDSNFVSHILGSKFENVSGAFDLRIEGNNRLGAGIDSNRPSSTVGASVHVNSGDLSIKTGKGNIDITAGGDGIITLTSSDVIFNRKLSKPADQREIAWNGFSPQIKNSQNTVLESTKTTIKSSGKTTIEGGVLNITSLGQANYTTEGKKVEKIEINSIETINGILPDLGNIGVAKRIEAISGSMEFKTLNPAIGGFDFQVGPFGFPTEVNFGATGIKMTSYLGDIDIFATRGFKVGTIQGIELKSTLTGIDISNRMGELSISPATGHITLGNKVGSLYKTLDQMLDAIMQLTVPTGTGPSGPPINVSIFTKLKAELALWAK